MGGKEAEGKGDCSKAGQLNLVCTGRRSWTARHYSTHLDIVLIAPLCREGCLSPSIVHGEQRNVVPNIAPVKVLVRIVSKDRLVFGTIEDATASTHHGCYCHNLLRALHHRMLVSVLFPT